MSKSEHTLKRPFKRAATALVSFVLALSAGCGSIDPWGALSRTASDPSQPFTEEAPEAAIETSGTMPLPVERPLSLPECVDIALQRNPRTSAAWQASRAAAARLGRAKAEYLPAVGFSAGASRGDAAEPSGRPDTGANDRYQGVFGVRWLAFDGGAREARVAGAEAELLAAGFLHNTALQDLALAVEEAYYALLAAQSFEKVARETVGQRTHQLTLAEARHRVGVVARSDVLKAQTEKADAELALIRARNDVHVARGVLCRTMGVTITSELQIAPVTDAPDAHTMLEINALFDQAAQNRPELKAALANIAAQRAAVQIGESRYWPSLGIDTSFGWFGQSLLPDRRQWNLGVLADLLLFSGFDRTYQLHGARAELARTVARQQDVLQGIELEVWTTYWRTLEAGQAVQAARSLVASARESARLAEGEYKNGTGAMVDLIVAQTASTAARNRLVRARLDWYTARARFARAVGNSMVRMRRDAVAHNGERSR